MGTFKKLINFDKMARYSAVNSNNYDNNWTDISGTLRGYASYGLAISPWYVGTFGYTYTEQIASNGNCSLFLHPSSNSDIPYDSTTVPDEIASSTSVAFTRFVDGSGWVANITIVGTSGNTETIRSLVFTRCINHYSSNYANGVFWAYILDTPIELNASNNYTTNFTISIKFE